MTAPGGRRRPREAPPHARWPARPDRAPAQNRRRSTPRESGETTPCPCSPVSSRVRAAAARNASRSVIGPRRQAASANADTTRRPSGSAADPRRGAEPHPTRRRTRTRSGISSSRSTDPTTIGSSDCDVATRHVASGPAHTRPRSKYRHDSATSRSAEATFMYCRFIHASLSTSNTAALCPTRPSSNRRAISLDRQHFFALTRRPPEQRQIVHQRLRQIPALAELGHARRAVPLRQRRVVGTEDERQVRECRRHQPKRLVNQQLPRRVRDVILATHDMRSPP